MKEDAKEFFSEVTVVLKKHFKKFYIEVLMQSSKSFKANVHLAKNLFISVRYNSRNGRTDFALIYNNKRIFGYDNLKKWHCHPYESPEEHIPCDKPSIDKILSEMKQVYEVIKK